MTTISSLLSSLGTNKSVNVFSGETVRFSTETGKQFWGKCVLYGTNLRCNQRQKYSIHHFLIYSGIFNRPGAAGAVL